MIRAIGIAIIFSAITISFAGTCCESNHGAHKKTTADKSSAGCPYMQSNAAAESKKDTALAAVKVSSVQKTCPVMGGTVNRNLYVDYQGKRIYVCCKRCINDVKKNPEKYIKKLEEKKEPIESIN